MVALCDLKWLANQLILFCLLFSVFDLCYLWQDNELRSSGTATMVHFDYQQQKSVALPNEIIDKFQQILKDKN